MKKLIKVTLLFLLVALTGLVPSSAHWKYPPECCHNLDCGPIVKMMPLENNTKLIVIKLDNGTERTAVFPDNFKLRPALDEKQHACISHDSKPLCWFLHSHI